MKKIKNKKTYDTKYNQLCRYMLKMLVNRYMSLNAVGGHHWRYDDQQGSFREMPVAPGWPERPVSSSAAAIRSSCQARPGNPCSGQG